MANMPPVKMETDSASTIKPDPDSTQEPQPMDEDDAFEDTGELELPAQPHKVWLLRVPKVLHKAWDVVNEDQEVQLGVLRRNKRTGKVSIHSSR